MVVAGTAVGARAEVTEAATAAAMAAATAEGLAAAATVVVVMAAAARVAARVVVVRVGAKCHSRPARSCLKKAPVGLAGAGTGRTCDVSFGQLPASGSAAAWLFPFG